MNLPGYDAWKTMSPDDERPDDDVQECPFCGSRSGCGLESDDGDIEPPCVENMWGPEERDPDSWRDEQIEARMDREMDR